MNSLTKKFAYYNEIDPKAAAWLRELIKAGHIAPGEVDERSIEDVSPDDIKSFKQCHFFAGIGVWSYALRQAGWPDDREVWTGSCPCQPFSSAGKSAGFADERHLWPAMHYLIEQRRPRRFYGEQVASKDGLAWLDLVQTDMEATGFAFGATDICAAGVGAPHIRQRLFFVGNNEGVANTSEHRSQRGISRGADKERKIKHRPIRLCRPNCGVFGETIGINLHRQVRLSNYCSGEDMADSECQQYQRRLQRSEFNNQKNGSRPPAKPTRYSRIGQLANPCSVRLHRTKIHAPQPQKNGPDNGLFIGVVEGLRNAGTGPTNGKWEGVDWLSCRDGYFRAVEPGTFPLVDGAAARVGRLRGYGNAINAEVAKIFIESTMEF